MLEILRVWNFWKTTQTRETELLSKEEDESKRNQSQNET